MKHSPQNKIFSLSQCLSHQKLSDYNSGKLSKQETHQVEEHLIDCELCSQALAGFALIPVSENDLQDIHKRIDVSINKGGGFFSAKTLLSGIAAMAIIGTFFFYNKIFNQVSPVKDKLIAEKNMPEVKAEMEKGKPVTTTIPNDIQDKTIVSKKAKTIFPKENFTDNALAENKKPDIVVDATADNKQKAEDKKDIEKVVTPEPVETVIEPQYNAPYEYILDLKITDYQRFYYTNDKEFTPRSKNVPAPFESKLSKTKDNEEPLERTQKITDILNKGLMYFKAQNFVRANEQLAILIEQNKNDVNALFYSALSLYNLDKQDAAIKYLDRVLLSPNNVFHPEAKWYKALALLKKNDKEKAREVFNSIVSEKGFYAKQAKEKLKDL